MYKTITFLLLLITLQTAAQEQFAFATVKNGKLEGIHNAKNNLNLFLGVPFAEPPVGDLRWKAPQPAKNWTGVKNAKKFGNRPVQTNVWGDMIYRSDTMSEDCLYLNIWAPSNKGNKLPVLVYFYGGGFVAGESSEPRYDGAAMAQKGMVAVTVNYRLNIFGFFAHPELSKEAAYNSSGNYGLLDQVAALKWVQENISAFGGDPKRVTIAGESAGSISVSAQMASPLAKGLFAGAIGQSGAAIFPTTPPVVADSAEAIGKAFAEKAGYASIAALRTLSTAELFKLYNGSKRFGFPVVMDGYFLPKTLPQIFKAREQSMIPLLLGWTSAESNENAFLNGRLPTKENFIAAVKESFPSDAEQVLKLFPHQTENEIRRSSANIASDRFIVYSTWKWFNLHLNNSNQKVYRYIFSKIMPHNAAADKQAIGAGHASDIPYFMNNLYLLPQIKWTEEDRLAANTASDYFANFVIKGNPNGNRLLNWPAAKPYTEEVPVMDIDAKPHVLKEGDARFQFWENYLK